MAIYQKAQAQAKLKAKYPKSAQATARVTRNSATLWINGVNYTAYLKNQTLSMSINTLDAVLVDPPSVPAMGANVGFDLPFWHGTLTSRIVDDSNISGHKFVTITATNEDEIVASVASSSLVDAEYRNLQVTTTLYNGVTEVRGTLETFKAGFYPGQTFNLTSLTQGYSAQNFGIKDIQVSWLKSTLPLYTISFGDPIVDMSVWINSQIDDAVQFALDDIVPIDETRITDGAVTTPKLAANAVTAAKIAARSITADKLMIGGGRYLTDPDFESGDWTGWTFGTSGGGQLEAIGSDPAWRAQGTYYGTFSTGAGNYSEIWQLVTGIHPGEYFILSALLTNATSALAVQWLDADGNSISTDSSAAFPSAGGYGGNGPPRLSHLAGPAPTNTAGARLIVGNAGASGAVLLVDDVWFTRADDLINADGSVYIDSSGIVIKNGSLTLEDEFGLTIMEASGFEGSWFDLTTLGLYNARLLQGVVGTLPTGRSASLPYWTVGAGTNGIATFLSGGGVKFTFSGLGDKYIWADPVPCVQGERIELGFSYSMTRVAGTLGINHFIFFYDASDNFISSSTLNGVSETASVSPARNSSPDIVIAPEDTAYFKYQIQGAEAGTHNAGNIINIHGAYAKRATGAIPPGLVIADDAFAATASLTDPTDNLDIGQDAPFVRLQHSGDITLSGLVAPTSSDKRVVTLYNYSLERVTLVHDATSTAANRFYLPGGRQVVLPKRGSIQLMYDDVLTRWVALDSPPYSMAGTTFPVSPATDDRWYRTDKGMEFYYDGTQWVCTCPHTAGFYMWVTRGMGLAASAADSYACPLPVSRGLDIKIEAYECYFAVEGGGSALSGSHSWIGTIKTKPDDTTRGVLTINSGASGTHRNISDTTGDNEVIDITGSQVGLLLSWVKTGTPGNLEQSVVAHYRFIAT